ncbi:hypothetical protein K458DRAFT_363448 [Lentithecium fluviatile CBS 122367]|uniref:Methyltransferase domain-containing protein n=1 Tax=Lentithecium fluviatile CBS 122367 TaxID=1168545 RepID=A0A6G1J903_9PLEO|nr:hypothetical protein K458DRAFT_363448 [Lentithecium fluviatile CBS 122367]
MAQPNPTADNTKEQDNPDPKAVKPEDMPWFLKEVQNLEPEARELFEKYCMIPSDDVLSHVKQFRDKAFKIRPYPCLARFTFLEVGLTLSPQYAEILQRVKDGDTFLDLGCCVGQDIRKLVFDGAPSENTYGSDREKAFMDIGYDLFLDKDTLKTTFIGADIFDAESDLKDLAGKIDIIHTAFFFHLWDLEGQTQAVRRVVQLFKDKVGSLLVGRQLGNIKGGTSEKGRFRHDAESFAQMWKKVGEEMGMEWKVDAWLGEEDLWAKTQKEGLGDVGWVPPGSRVLNFTVRRVA